MRPGRTGEQGGFTIIEVLIALLVLLIGISGILLLQLKSVEATAFSRHATEASVLGEDKMEILRTAPVTALVDGDDQVDARGVLDPAGLYARHWEMTVGPNATTDIRVDVTWNEEGTDARTITMLATRKH